MNCTNRSWCQLGSWHFGDCRTAEDHARRLKYSKAICSAFHDSWDVSPTDFTNRHCDKIFALIEQEQADLKAQLRAAEERALDAEVRLSKLQALHDRLTREVTKWTLE